MVPYVAVLTHIADQNNTKAMKNMGVKNGYVLHLSILNHHFNSWKDLGSRYESPFTAIRKKNVLGSLGGTLGGRITQAEELKPGQESWVPAPSAGWQETLEGLFIHLKQGHRQKKN